MSALWAGLALALAAGDEGQTLEQRFLELTARASALACEERAAALVALGPDALPLLVAELERRPRDETLRAAARGFGRAALARWLAAGEPPAAGPRATLALVAEVGGAGELELALARCDASTDLATEALGRLLARDAALVEPLLARVPALEGAASTCAVLALGGLGSEDALDGLGRLLAFEKPELELCLLSAIERGAPRSGASEETRAEVRDRLWSGDALVLRKAASVCGLLEDDEALERLVGVLEHPDEHVVAAAVRALRLLSGRALPGDPATWQRWLAREEAWFERRAAYAFAALHAGPREGRLGAAAELAQHRLHRRSIAAELEQALERDPDPLVRAAVCDALGRLGLRAAAEPLAAALEDEDPRVARGAALALARLGAPARKAPSATLAAAR